MVRRSRAGRLATGPCGAKHRHAVPVNSSQLMNREIHQAKPFQERRRRELSGTVPSALVLTSYRQNAALLRRIPHERSKRLLLKRLHYTLEALKFRWIFMTLPWLRRCSASGTVGESVPKAYGRTHGQRITGSCAVALVLSQAVWVLPGVRPAVAHPSGDPSCYTPPFSLTLSPYVPHDVPAGPDATVAQLAVFAWQEFVALNWVAMDPATTRCAGGPTPPRSQRRLPRHRARQQRQIPPGRLADLPAQERAVPG